MPTARVDDITIYYEVHGSGRPLLLIGGLGADLTLFTPVVAELATSGQVIAYVNRGSGRTDQPDRPYSISQMAHDALRLMDHLGIDQADLVGISMGGRIALEATLAAPERVRRLVLVSTSARSTASSPCPGRCG